MGSFMLLSKAIALIYLFIFVWSEGKIKGMESEIKGFPWALKSKPLQFEENCVWFEGLGLNQI
jgi:hypothetical protein